LTRPDSVLIPKVDSRVPPAIVVLLLAPS
jgi:hypothetical protein